MSDMDPLYELMKDSAEDMSEAAVEMKSMMTADATTDVTIGGYGPKPSFSKQLRALAALPADTIRESHINAAIGTKTQVPATFSGELLNGATGWNGFNACPSQYYGGWLIPAGSTGYNSYVTPKVTLTASLLSEMMGKRVLFIFGVTHSAALKDDIGDQTKFVPYAWLNGVAVSDPNVVAINMSATESVVLFEADITSSSTDVSVALQYKTNSAAESQLTFYTNSAFYRVLEAKSFIASLDAYSRAKAVPPVDSGSVVIMPAFIELFKGATRDAATGKISIPAGSTGNNTYYGRFDAVHNNRNRAGETIRLVAIFNCSAKFIQTLTSYTIGIAKKLDGVQSTGEIGRAHV